MAGDGKHDCPGQCGRRVHRDYVACRGCWYSVPRDLRHDLWEAVKGSPEAPGYGEARTAVLAWLAEHPGPNPLPVT